MQGIGLQPNPATPAASPAFNFGDCKGDTMNTHLQFFEQIKKISFYLFEHHGTVAWQTLADFYKPDSDNQTRLDGLGALLEETVSLLHSIDLPPDEPIVTIIAKLNDIESA